MKNVTIFEAAPRPDCEWILPEREEDFDLLRCGGFQRAAAWTPIRMRLLREDVGEYGRQWQGRESDFPWLASSELVIRERARNALCEILERYGELLPLICDDAKVWLYNVTHVVDGLDEDRSRLWRFSAGGMHVRQAAFRLNAVRGVAVFKIPQTLYGPIYFGQEFVDKVQSSALTGPDFRPVWTSICDA